MHQSGLSLPFVFVCLLYDLLSFLFHSRVSICNQHCLGWKIFCLCFSVSRGMRLWETDLQSLLNHTELSIPEVRWPEPHSEFILLSSQIHTWEYLVLTGSFEVYLKNFVSQIRCAAETRQHVLAFIFREKKGEELSWDLFIGTNSCWKL